MREDTANDKQYSHHRTANEHEIAATDTVNEVDGESQTCGIADQIATGQKVWLLTAVPRECEHLRRVCGDEVDTREFLHDLNASTEKDTTTSVQMVLLKQHTPI